MLAESHTEAPARHGCRVGGVVGGATGRRVTGAAVDGTEHAGATVQETVDFTDERDIVNRGDAEFGEPKDVTRRRGTPHRGWTRPLIERIRIIYAPKGYNS